MGTLSQSRKYKLGGVDIEFPNELQPYKSQITLMAKAVTGARKGQNCLLESPTGSGKTMAMLCSLLAWQRQFKSEAETASRAAKVQQSSNRLDFLEESGDANSLATTPSGRVNRRKRQADKVKTPAASTPPVIPSIMLDSLSRSQSPDMFDGEDFDDFKPPKKKLHLQTASSSSEGTAVLRDLGHVVLNSPTAGAEPMLQAQDNQDSSKPAKVRVPKIFFATRTHKQITQVVKEFRRTPYKDIPMTILNSREHSCIHQLEAPFTSKTEMCHALMDDVREAGQEESLYSNKIGCIFKRNLDQKVRSGSSMLDAMDLQPEAPWDIEDLVAAGKKKRLCPYFATRDLLVNAEIIFCPYNYLVDPLIRKSMMINLKGHVILFDEAHNIEDSMRSATSFSIEEPKLIEVIEECHNAVLRGGHSGNYQYLGGVLQSLLDWMRQMSDKLTVEDKRFNDRSVILPGTAYVAHMDNKGIGTSNYEKFKDVCSLVFADESREGGSSNESSQEESVVIHQLYKPSGKLKMVAQGLELVWGYLFTDHLQFADDYNIVLAETTSRVFLENKDSDGWHRAPKVHAKPQLNLHLWCMNPAVGFSDFREALSVQVTSGTLSPMDSFQSELGSLFPHHLSTDHVIDPSQAWVATVSVGPRGRTITGTYQNAITLDYQDEVGDSILQICQAVPFGVLCFFSSYSTMDNVIKRWQMTDKWERLVACKHVVKEPRGSSEFSEAMHQYDAAVKRAELYQTHRGGIPAGEQTGALFLAVFRGKLSEGIDFKDNHARAVITVSIPFPSMGDLNVKLKKKFNDRHHMKTRHMLPGNQWYEIQAYRAINQALGRCVRHRHDWGAIILLDSRFSPGSKATSSISKWATKQIRHFTRWNEMYAQLQQFMQARTAQLTEACAAAPAAPILYQQVVKHEVADMEIIDLT